MRFFTTLAIALSGISVANAVSAPAVDNTDIIMRGEIAAEPLDHALEKRRGGGRSGGFSGGGRSGGGGSSSRPPPNTLSTSKKGGTTSDGSGVPRTFGGGNFYAGGARVPFTAGKTSPSGIKPTLLPRSRVVAFYPGLWLYGAYVYPYRFTFHNASRHNNTQTANVACLCQDYQVCGCDNNSKSNYIKDLIGNGSFSALNTSLIKIAKWKGKERLFINGSLANGTTASSFATGSQSMLSHATWAVVGAALTYSFWLV